MPNVLLQWYSILMLSSPIGGVGFPGTPPGVVGLSGLNKGFCPVAWRCASIPSITPSVEPMGIATRTKLRRERNPMAAWEGRFSRISQLGRDVGNNNSSAATSCTATSSNRQSRPGKASKALNLGNVRRSSLDTANGDGRSSVLKERTCETKTSHASKRRAQAERRHAHGLV